MPQAHFDTQILNYHIVTPPVKGLQRCWQGLSHSPSHSKTSIAWMLTWLAAANVVLFHWLSTHAIGSQSNGNALQRLGVRPYRFHPRQGWRFVSCAPVIAALLFGCSANAASLQTDDCLFNWVESNYPNLFAPTRSSTAVGTPYTYRYYSATNTYLGVSSFDNHVYYIGSDGKLQDEGILSDWLPKASCPTPVPPQIDCLFNWAESNYSSLFAPFGSATIVWSNYIYRYYSKTNAFLAVSSVDNHFYYLGANGNLQNEGPISAWLSLAGCQNTFAVPPFPVIYIHGLNSSALNDLQTNPLPNTVSYFSILGIGVDTISSNYPPFLKSGDFIVSALSQDISKVSSVFQIKPKSVTLDILDRGNCDYHGISILHLCEPGDPNVWEAILLDL